MFLAAVQSCPGRRPSGRWLGICTWHCHPAGVFFLASASRVVVAAALKAFPRGASQSAFARLWGFCNRGGKMNARAWSCLKAQGRVLFSEARGDLLGQLGSVLCWLLFDLNLRPGRRALPREHHLPNLALSPRGASRVQSASPFTPFPDSMRGTGSPAAFHGSL